MNKASLLTIALLAGGCSGALHEPLPDTARRATPLSFGVYVTPDPDQNPIDPPERFTGYHAATDFEVTTKELEAEVPVFAICSGKILHSGYVEGYGGALIHDCRIRGERVTVLYGHLLVESLPEVGGTVRSGQQIGLLAPANSRDSGETRKHLHLGIHRGDDLSYLGYVHSEQDLTEFMNPAEIIRPGILWNLLPSLTPYWKNR